MENTNPGTFMTLLLKAEPQLNAATKGGFDGKACAHFSVYHPYAKSSTFLISSIYLKNTQMPERERKA